MLRSKQKKISSQYLLFIGAMVMLSWPFISTFGPVIEGKFLPVVVDTVLTKTISEGKSQTIIYGSSTRDRDCTFSYLEWFYGNSDGSVLLPLEILEKPKIRDDGVFDFGPWRVGLEESLVKSQSFAIVYHQCHPFWKTQTKFWP